MGSRAGPQSRPPHRCHSLCLCLARRASTQQSERQIILEGNLSAACSCFRALRGWGWKPRDRVLQTLNRTRHTRPSSARRPRPVPAARGRTALLLDVQPPPGAPPTLASRCSCPCCCRWPPPLSVRWAPCHVSSTGPGHWRGSPDASQTRGAGKGTPPVVRNGLEDSHGLPGPDGSTRLCAPSSGPGTARGPGPVCSLRSVALAFVCPRGEW